MGTFGTGPFSSDGALDLLDNLTGQSVGQRREVLEGIFLQVRDRPGLLGREFFPDEVVAAAAIVAAGMAGGEDIQRDLAGQGYGISAVLVPVPDPALCASALEALLAAAGRDGPWHDGWVDPETAAEARQTTDRLAAILVREGHLGECVAALPVVAGPCLVLASSAPAGPGPDAPGVGDVRLEQAGQQPADLGHGVADHSRLAGAAPFFRVCARLAESQARASIDKVTWAYQARQERTWYWSSPASPLACWMASSMCQRLPAAQARSAVPERRGP